MVGEVVGVVSGEVKVKKQKRVQVTERDERLLRWLDVVRLADVETVAVMLGADASRGPVGVRVAQVWVERMRSVGLVASERPRYRASQVVWATRAATGRSEPNPYAGTVPHSLEVARQTALLRAQGVTATPDTRRDERGLMADAVLTWPNGARQFLEVELSTKTKTRLDEKLLGTAQRWADEGVAGTLYIARRAPAQAVEQAAQRVLAESIRDRLVIVRLDEERSAA